MESGCVKDSLLAIGLSLIVTIIILCQCHALHESTLGWLSFGEIEESFYTLAAGDSAGFMQSIFSLLETICLYHILTEMS